MFRTSQTITVGGDLGGRDSELWTYLLGYLMAFHHLQGLCNVNVRMKVTYEQGMVRRSNYNYVISNGLRNFW
jgi:hypothetical protein